MDFSEILQEIMLVNNLRQKDIAERCNLTSGQISAIIHRVRIPNYYTMKKIIEGLDIDPLILFGLKPVPTKKFILWAK